MFRTFPLAGAFYRAIANWQRSGGLGWAGRCGQSGVVSLGLQYTNATHIVKEKNEAAGRVFQGQRQSSAETIAVPIRNRDE